MSHPQSITDGPKKRGPATRPLAQRFWEKVHCTKTCWIWTGHQLPKGYGKISIGGDHGQMLLAHRVSWELHNGPITDGLFVCHRCNNPSCVRPDHLYLGTNSENIRDAIRDGIVVGGSSLGEKNGSARLTPGQVVDIRRMRNSEGLSLRELAVEYGVSVSAIHRAATGRTWAHLPPDISR
jgi:hypothetical protein